LIQKKLFFKGVKMIDINTVISKISNTLNRKLAIISDDQIIKSNDFVINLKYQEVVDNVYTNLYGFNIYEIKACQKKYYILIEHSTFVFDESTKVTLSMIEISLSSKSDVGDLIDIIKEKNSITNIEFLNSKYSNLIDCYFFIIKYSKEYKDEFHEILNNSINVDVSFHLDDYLIVMSKDEDISEVLYSLISNTLTELLIEITISVGGKITSISELPKLYNNSIEAFTLKEKYNLKEYLLFFDKLIVYRVVSNINYNFKQDILYSIFTNEFDNIIDKELEHMIDEYFKNNLNITDTAKAIHVHRNTLLYRIDKIQNYTNLDLKNFEDSMTFKIAWLIRKEHKKKSYH